MLQRADWKRETETEMRGKERPSDRDEKNRETERQDERKRVTERQR